MMKNRLVHDFLKAHYLRHLHRKENIIAYNFWRDFNVYTSWLFCFMEAHKLLPNDKRLTFFSNFGDRKYCHLLKGDYNIFFSGENLQSRYLTYSDHMLNDDFINLALGFNYFEDKRYMRFPLWMFYMYRPDADENEIKRRTCELRLPPINNTSRLNFCSLIASHDDNNVRLNFLKQFEEIGSICCPGLFYHNDDTLKQKFNDNKLQYLQTFQFNICPENSNACGYTTEKIFQAIASGCIPIYWGDYNNPEPSMINKDAVIFVDPKTDNKLMVEKVRILNENPSLYAEFAAQPRLLPKAEEYVIEMFHELETKLRSFLR